LQAKDVRHRALSWKSLNSKKREKSANNKNGRIERGMSDQKTANPAPLGLLGFGVTTVLLNFVHNFNLGSVNGMILAMGLTYGGLAQIIAGILEFKRGNTFSTVAFTSYGFFWWSYVFLNMLPNNSFTAGFYGLPPSESLAAYFLMWDCSPSQCSLPL